METTQGLGTLDRQAENLPAVSPHNDHGGLPMNDRSVQFSYSLLGALILAGLAIGLVLANFWPTGNDQLGFAGVLCGQAGVVLWIRSFLCQIASRERMAFELGRDSATLHSLPRSTSNTRV